MPQSRVALAESLSDTLASLQTARSGLSNAWALRMSASEKAHFAAAGPHGAPRVREVLARIERVRRAVKAARASECQLVTKWKCGALMLTQHKSSQ